MAELDTGHKLELVELIYSAGMNPSEWVTFVARLGELLPHAAVAFQLVDLMERSPSVCLTQNWEDGAQEAYVGYFASISPWLEAHHFAGIGMPYVADDTCPVSSYRTSEFFSDFILPYKVMCGAVAVKLFDDEKRMAMVSMNYPENLGGRVLEPMRRLLAELSPHLRRAIELNGKFAQLGAAARSVPYIVDGIPCPCFLVTADARVRHMNTLARQALEDRRGLLLTSRDHIAHERSTETAKLHQLITKTARFDPIDLEAAFAPFTVPQEPGPNLIFASPTAHPSAPVLLTVQYRSDDKPISCARLVNAFGLTLAESQVVAALAKGTSLTEHAENTKRSVHTVRHQLKHALAKTDCRTQAELVALVWRMLCQTI